MTIKSTPTQRDLHNAFASIMNAARLASAGSTITYAFAGARTGYDSYSSLSHDDKFQLLARLLGNIQYWRGNDATIARKILKAEFSRIKG